MSCLGPEISVAQSPPLTPHPHALQIQPRNPSFYYDLYRSVLRGTITFTLGMVGERGCTVKDHTCTRRVHAAPFPPVLGACALVVVGIVAWGGSWCQYQTIRVVVLEL